MASIKIAFPVGAYRFNIINWNLEEFKKIDANNLHTIECTNLMEMLTVCTCLRVIG